MENIKKSISKSTYKYWLVVFSISIDISVEKILCLDIQPSILLERYAKLLDKAWYLQWEYILEDVHVFRWEEWKKYKLTYNYSCHVHVEDLKNKVFTLCEYRFPLVYFILSSGLSAVLPWPLACVNRCSPWKHQPR